MVPQGAREKPQGLPCSQIVMLDVRKLEELCRVVPRLGPGQPSSQAFETRAGNEMALKLLHLRNTMVYLGHR